MVGGASLWFPLLDNLTKCWGAVGVDPDHRRRGIGSALIAQIVTRVEQEGRTTMVTESAYPFDRRQDHPYRRFAEANGFTVAIDEILRILPLPVDPALLQTLAIQAAPHHTAYRIESFVNDLPDGLLASYCALSNQLGVDAPTGDVDFEAESMTPQLWLERIAKEKEMGRTRFTTVAIDETGNVVAYTDLILPPPPSRDVWQWGTLVHRDQRGHRLGMAVKVRNLQQLAAADSGRASPDLQRRDQPPHGRHQRPTRFRGHRGLPDDGAADRERRRGADRAAGSGQRRDHLIGGGVRVGVSVDHLRGELVHALPVAQVTDASTQCLYGDRLDLIARSTHAAIS